MACPVNTQSAMGSIGIGSCVCNAGFSGTSSSTNASSCSPCAAGKFKSVAANELCEDCPINTQSIAGSILCGCSAGFTRKNGSTCTKTAEVLYAEALAATVSQAVGAAAGAAAAAGGVNPAVIDQIQFLSIVGNVGGAEANPATAAFSSGFSWANFEFQVGRNRDENARSRRKVTILPNACSDIHRDLKMYTETLTPDGAASSFVHRQLTCLIILGGLYCVRSSLRWLQMWWWYDDPPPPDMSFPGWEGPVFVAQIFGICDTAAGLCLVDCLPWRIAGALWLLFGPIFFLLYASHRMYRLITVSKTLSFKKSPKHTVMDMGEGLRETATCSARAAQCFVFMMDVRFVGGWTKADAPAKFWGWTMANYTDGFVFYFTWTLAKKIFNALNKHMFVGANNAVVSIAIYGIDLVLHVFFRPFRDNTVGLSQALSAVTNLAGVLTAALPFLAEAPEWMNPGFLMFISVAGTSVQLLQAMMDPIFKGTTFILSLAGAGSPVASTTGFGKTARAFWDALKTRFGKIFMARSKAAAAAHVKATHESYLKLPDVIDHVGAARFIQHESLVFKKGRVQPGYQKRFLVLKNAVLAWYRVEDLLVDDLDAFVVDKSSVSGQAALAGCSIEPCESKDDSQYHARYGKGAGFLLHTKTEDTSEDTSYVKTRRFMFTNEASRDVWVFKLNLVLDILSKNDAANNAGIKRLTATSPSGPPRCLPSHPPSGHSYVPADSAVKIEVVCVLNAAPQLQDVVQDVANAVDGSNCRVEGLCLETEPSEPMDPLDPQNWISAKDLAGPERLARVQMVLHAAHAENGGTRASPAGVAESLRRQLADPCSQLRHGRHTNRAIAVSMLPTDSQPVVVQVDLDAGSARPDVLRARQRALEHSRSKQGRAVASPHKNTPDPRLRSIWSNSELTLDQPPEGHVDARQDDVGLSAQSLRTVLLKNSLDIEKDAERRDAARPRDRGVQ